MAHLDNINRNIDPSLFRAYDIRGIVDSQLNTQVIYTIALAFAELARRHEQNTVIVGYDGRLSSPDLSTSFCQGLLDSGIDVINIGAVSSPMLYFATHHLSSNTGVMITGSHNPVNYNGLKMLISGQALSEQVIQDLYQLTQTHDFKATTSSIGQLQTYNIYPEYQKVIVEKINLDHKLKVVVDCGNSIMGQIAPDILRQLGCEVIELFCEVDGRFPNHHPDPSEPENLQDLVQSVKQHQANLGIAFDGDGDRLGAVTNTGDIIPADQILMLLSQAVLQEQPNSTIVYDVKCTMHLAPFIEKHQGKAIEWKTGHSLIKQKMLTTKAALAGEMSGHIFFKHRWFGFDDGLYAGCRLLELLSKNSKTFSELHQQLPKSVATNEIKIPVPEDKKFQIIEDLKQNEYFKNKEISTLDGLKVYYPNGWALIRASNTSPNLTLRFEADDDETLNNLITGVKAQLETYL